MLSSCEKSLEKVLWKQEDGFRKRQACNSTGEEA